MQPALFDAPEPAAAPVYEAADFPFYHGAKSMADHGFIAEDWVPALSRQDALRDTLHAFKTHKIDILIGTQMIAKGLHFPNVTLVGILNADLGLHVPDFRAGERTFQLLTQVAGRAGRGDLAGEVIVQTFTPQAEAVHPRAARAWGQPACRPVLCRRISTRRACRERARR